MLSSNSRRAGLIVDVLSVFMSFYVTYFLSSEIKGQALIASGSRVYYATFLFVIASWGASLILSAEYPIRRLTNFYEELWIVIRSNVLGVLFFAILGFVLKYNHFSRLFIGSYFVDNIILMSIIRMAIRLFLGMVRNAGRNYRTRLIVGIGPQATSYLNGLENQRQHGLRVIGYLSSPKSAFPAPYLGRVEDLPRILAEHPVDGVVITLPITHPHMEWVMKQCEMQGVSVELLLDGLTSRINSSVLVHGMGVSRLVLSSIPHSSTGLALKRLTDIVISFILLALVSPLLALIAITIRLEDGGPVIFSQVRSGLHGRPFKMHKFRSMCVDAEAKKQDLLHLNEMSGPVFKIAEDPRITKVGRFLRKTSLDELPQLWDVLVGSMSLVGPRPPLPSEVELYDAYQRRRLSVKPGITCLWQVSGRNNIDFDRWVALDLEYIDSWSYLEDWKILLMTVPAVLRRDGAR
ncbi:sugar transferase [Alicyclobacillus tolerans]|uniref:sugar transferase n=1 Tax=Alicyclobacillus tolerans TaxID=90970 RepID=UPI001F22E135|nr:sugar transferase [Alicyclobacillus tolerans]MCF8568349.1 sugar transferase [Alicyclobacillus tolerans]